MLIIRNNNNKILRLKQICTVVFLLPDDISGIDHSLQKVDLEVSPFPDAIEVSLTAHHLISVQILRAVHQTWL